MRLAFGLVLCVAACGGGGGGGGGGADGGSGPDAADLGFNKPKHALQANMMGSNQFVWDPIGAADLSCLGSANIDEATTVAVTLNTHVLDFQFQTPVPGATVVAFPDIDTTTSFSNGSSDGSGAVAISIPAGTKRFGIKLTQAQDFDTFLLNQKVDPSTAVQTIPDKIQAISLNTGATLPTLVNSPRIPGTGIVAGAVRDCNAHEMSNFIATVSSTSGTNTPLPGADAFYFAETVGLPVHHNQADASSPDGLFMIIQLPVAATAYVQAWGYVSDADLAADKLSLVSELAVPVLADTVITGSFEPLRAP